MKQLFPAIFLMLLVACGNNPTTENHAGSAETTTASDNDKPRIVSLCNTASETIFFLGLEDQVVGVDITSKFPESYRALPQLGHYPNFNTEAIISLKPDVVFGRTTEVKPELKTQLEALDIELVLFEQDYSVAGTETIIDLIANQVELTNKGRELKEGLRASSTLLSPLTQKPRSLFIYARGSGPLLVSGTNTQMDGLIRLAGGQNAITEFEGFKPLSAEGLIAANPEVIIIFNSSLQALSGWDGIKNVPGMDATVAGQKEQFIDVDEVLASSFSPRLGEAALALNQYYQSLEIDQE